MAARISTASRPSRKTMIAALVTTVVRLALSPSVARASSSSSSSARRVSRTSRRAAPLAISSARPVVALGAEPDQALDVGREAGVERLQPPLRAELEERVGLEPRLLGLAALAGADRGLHAVERQRDEVVVGVVGRLLPRGGHRRLELVSIFVALRLDRRRGDVRRSCAARPRDDGAELRSSATASAAVRAGSRLASWSRRSAKAASAAVWNATASWISKSSVTRPSLTPRPYSTGTSATKRSSCWARRAASSSVNGAAVKPSSAVSISRARGGDAAAVAARGASPAGRRTPRAAAAAAARRGPLGSAAARICQ